MDQDLFLQIKLWFDTIEKNAEDRYKYIQDNFNLIRKQQDDSKNERRGIQETIQAMILGGQERYLVCPTTKKVNEIEKRVEDNKDEYLIESLNSRFYSKNPNIFIGAVTVSVFLLFCSVFGGYLVITSKQKNIEEKVTNIEQLQKKETIETNSMYKREIKSINKK